MTLQPGQKWVPGGRRGSTSPKRPKKPKPPSKMPVRKEIVPSMLAAIEGAAAIGCPVEEIATVVGFAKTQFYERLKESPEAQEAIERGREKGKTTLRRLQWRAANAGDKTMLVWLGKVILGQTDRIDVNNRQLDADGNVIAPGATFVLKVER